MAGTERIRADHHVAATVARALLVCAAYVVAARLGLLFATSNANVTAVWPPSGIAVGALFVFGPRVWPAVAAGALIANLTNGATPALAAGIAVGNTLGPLVAVWVLRARLRISRRLDHIRDVFRLTLVGAAAMVITATGGTLALWSGGGLGASRLVDVWWLWWAGDAMGVAAFAPTVLVLFGSDLRRSRCWTHRREFVAMLASAAVVVPLVFSVPYPVRFLVFPMLLWASLRFDQPGATTVATLTSALAMWRVATGDGAFPGLSDGANVLSVQAFSVSVMVTSLIVGALTLERRRVLDALADTAMLLDDRVRDRTTDLLDANERLADAQALAHLGSWSWDVRADALQWSTELYRIYGIEPDRAASYADFLALVHPLDRDRVAALIEDCFASGESFDFEHRIVRPSGEVRWLRGRGRVIREGTATVAMYGTAQDITEHKLAEQTLRNALARETEAAERLRELDRTKDAMLTAVSHELRTPLTVVLGTADTLKRPDVVADPATLNVLVDRLAANAERLDRLMSDLLDLDRLGRGVIEPRRRPTRLGPLVMAVVESIDTSRHRVTVNVDDIAADVDARQVERIVENLVANACKHTPHGTRVCVRAERTSDGVVISVADEGPGVPPPARHHIFEPFHRMDVDAAAPGTGIGLSLVARFAELHGGRAWVEANEAGGATFKALLAADEGPEITSPDETERAFDERQRDAPAGSRG